MHASTHACTHARTHTHTHTHTHNGNTYHVHSWSRPHHRGHRRWHHMHTGHGHGWHWGWDLRGRNHSILHLIGCWCVIARLWLDGARLSWIICMKYSEQLIVSDTPLINSSYSYVHTVQSQDCSAVHLDDKIECLGKFGVKNLYRMYSDKAGYQIQRWLSTTYILRLSDDSDSPCLHFSSNWCKLVFIAYATMGCLSWISLQSRH